ncbi:MAG: heavy metal translocating P-type ATPase metal-binding domain-containing protein [Pseudomonadota bacterium]
MPIKDEKLACSLCGLPLKVLGFSLKTHAGAKYFCCEGCLGVYQLLHGSDVPADIDAQASGRPTGLG